MSGSTCTHGCLWNKPNLFWRRRRRRKNLVAAESASLGTPADGKQFISLKIRVSIMSARRAALLFQAEGVRLRVGGQGAAGKMVLLTPRRRSSRRWWLSTSTSFMRTADDQF